MLSTRGNRLAEFAERYSLGVLMGALALVSIFYACVCVVYQPGFAIGDWLINYSQGFIRRGLFGEAILLSGHLLHVPLPWMTLAVQIPIYLALLAGVYQLAAPLKRDVVWFCMMFSPAALPFMILDPLNGYRKEILLFAALTATILLVRRKISDALLALTLAALFALLVLAHESLIFCFPYFFASIAIGVGEMKRAAKICAAPFLLAVVLFDVVRHHPGNVADAIGICTSVGGTWEGLGGPRGLCSGSIAWLGVTFAQYHQQETEFVRYWPLYSFLAVLSFAPFIAALVVLYKRDKLRCEVRVIAGTAMVCGAASFGLFYATIDWGRWIHMQIVCLLLVILMTKGRVSSAEVNDANQLSRTRTAWRRPLLLGAFLYCTCWTLPVVALMPVRFGYLDLALYAHREIRMQKQLNALPKTEQ